MPTTSPRPNAAFDAFLAELAAPTADMIRAEIADKIAELPEAQRAAAEARLAEISDDDLMTRFGPKPAPARTRQTAPVIRAAVGFSNEDPAVITRRYAEAIAADAAGVPVQDQGATQFRGLGFRALARLTLAGIPGVNYMSDASLIDAAMTRSGQHGTSDFPLIAQSSAARVVAHTYQEAASPIERNLVVYKQVPDFRPVTAVARGGLANLLPLTEHGEFRSMTTVEAGESFQISTYGGTVNLSRTLLINDNLGLFGDLSADAGRAARRTETQLVVDTLTSGSGLGPILVDGQRVFHSTHGNVAGSGGALSESTLSAGLLAMQAQVGLGGEVIGIRPAYLVVAPAAEIAARKLLATVTATKVADVNALAGVVELLVDPRLAGTRWYLFAKPSDAPVLQVAHLAGQTGPQVQTKDRWDGLGMSLRVWLDVGATAVDFRGGYTNAGA